MIRYYFLFKEDLENFKLSWDELEAQLLNYQFTFSSTLNLLTSLLKDLEKNKIEKLALAFLRHLTIYEKNQIFITNKSILMAVKLLAMLQSLGINGHGITELHSKMEETRLLDYFE